MLFEGVLNTAKIYFPNIDIKYKNQSLLMTFFSKLLFWNKDWFFHNTSMIGNCIYYPSIKYTRTRPIASTISLLHELMYIYFKSHNIFIFYLSYLFPLYFKIYYEKKAYLSSLYILYVLGNKLKFDPELDRNKKIFLSNFSGIFYRYFYDFIKEFDDAVCRIKNNLRPYEDPIFDILDIIIRKNIK